MTRIRPRLDGDIAADNSGEQAECVNCGKRSPVASMRHVGGIGHLCTDIAACDARLEAEVAR